MPIQHLRTVGDGYCFNHHWPMWSQLLAEILDCQWQNFSLPGLGNEAMANIVLDQLENECLPNTLWVIQWAEPKRVDFRIDIDTAEFLSRIEKDPIYYKNFITTARGRKYWSSSASIQSWVQQYRDSMVLEQYQDRQRLYELAVTAALEKSQVKYCYISTPQMSQFRYSSQYLYLDVKEIQPISSIHLEFLEQFVLPQLEYDSSRLSAVREKTLAADTQRKNSNSYVPWDRNMHRRV